MPPSTPLILCSATAQTQLGRAPSRYFSVILTPASPETGSSTQGGEPPILLELSLPVSSRDKVEFCAFAGVRLVSVLGGPPGIGGVDGKWAEFTKATESSRSERATHQESAGRKSGVQESQWLLRFHTHGLLNSSFQPPAEIRVVRNDGSVQTSSFTAPCAWPTHVNTNPCSRESASSPSSVSIRTFPSNTFVLQVPH